jgi:transposase
LEYGFSLDQVASITGISRGWVCQLRTRFIKNEGNATQSKENRGGRRRQNMSFDEEVAFLAPFIDKAVVGRILVVGEIKRALEEKLGRKVALSSVYNLLHRHNWRKLVPDKRHPKADLKAQDDFKKTPNEAQGNRSPVAKRA